MTSRPAYVQGVRGVIVLCGLLTLSIAKAGGTHLSFLEPQGVIAAAQRVHFYWVLGIMAVLVAGPIFVLLPIFVWRYRYGHQGACYAPRWDKSGKLEIFMWSGPVVIVIALSCFVWRDAHRLDPYRPLPSAQAPLQVQVIGYDWKWLFIYPEQGVASLGILALPVGRPVALQLTSATVMQSFFIPALGSQIYAMGGMVTQLHLQADLPGASLGENTMYNGDGFHEQKFTAQAMRPADFDGWVNTARATGAPLTPQGLALIAQRGTGGAGTTGVSGARPTKGNAFFTAVGPRLFPAVVMATMEGHAVGAAAFDPADAAMPAMGEGPRAMAGRTR